MTIFCMCAGLWLNYLLTEPVPVGAVVGETINYVAIEPSKSTTLHGNLSAYNHGIFSAVVANRVAWGHLDLAKANAYQGRFIAVWHCDYLYHTATVTNRGETIEALIVDCANPAHTETTQLFLDGVIAELPMELLDQLGWQAGDIATVEIR